MRADETSALRLVLIVTGLSGAGKSSILRILEDLEHEVIDNAPLGMLDDIIARASGPVAIGVDTRTRGFNVSALLETLMHLRMNPELRVELIYATAEENILLRRFTATRRRHPLAPHSNIAEGIREETTLTAPLRAAADLVIDTSDMPPPDLRQFVESRFSPWQASTGQGLTVTLMSFAFPAGLPREADIVLDARFLQNPHYKPELAQQTGISPDVANYVAQDPDYNAFFELVLAMLKLVLPRFVREGKKYATIAIGCSGGMHRSVTLIENLARKLSEPDSIKECKEAGQWPIMVIHRELVRQGLSSWRWARKPTSP
ncbi:MULTISPECIES: RNase adapter RapZ [Acetobacter]|uniref:RNase adapter RapZ n=1 Tax=Acetobacter TaxID=434 RepID=UPI000A36FB61|nr:MULTISPECIES: RNase adapter RapZ [Acetobacter]MBS0986321.1 RNase adapter RapZ [Acetobacter thailandicus]OUI86637.1 glmZ(sRNA)-inactivating NTPase [Acetobacter sp. DmW_043]